MRTEKQHNQRLSLKLLSIFQDLTPRDEDAIVKIRIADLIGLRF
jgi:hypothetical protein